MITVSGLTKRYGNQAAVDNISFTCEPGTVTGFLGPNGAGKSTTMRIICGLTPPTSGSTSIAGVPYRQLSNPAWHVGILLDASAQHSGRTGREVMELSAQVLGVDRARVPELLDRVGLPPTAANKRIGNYSLGMRQRLGIAHALLGEPEVLILDEPANGLDPEGIHWMRYLLRAFAERGGTVLLSSHLLREIDVVADRLVVIGNGRIVAQGTRDELVTGTGVRVRALVPAELKQALARFNVSATPTADGAFIAQTDVATVGRAAAEAGVVLLELRPAEDGLENLFLSLTGTANRRDDA